MAAAAKNTSGLMFTIRKWCYNASRFNRYGLHYDDCRSEFDPDVSEAVRRLPDKIKDERNFRITRALQLSMIKRELPKDEWTKYEEDNKYLLPYLEEVIRERKEKEQWNKI